MSNSNSSPPRGATNKMLIDATHPEETRVVVLRNGRVEEFDYESAARKLLRGNIYLAKVTRVEPSLQAAFIDYGGNRHGFLAFNEIHPDYYQIPVADRRALIEAEAAAEAEEEAAADRAAEAAAARRARRRPPTEQAGDDAEDNAIDVTPLMPSEPMEAGADAHREQERGGHEHGEQEHADHERGDHERGERDQVESAGSSGDTGASREIPTSRVIQERTEFDPRLSASVPAPSDPDTRDPEPYTVEPVSSQPGEQPQVEGDRNDHAATAPEQEAGNGYRDRDAASEDHRAPSYENGNGNGAEQVETVEANEDVLEEVPARPRRRARSYKIQEVTKRRQVLLVQVVKEERGTKGAALTTYLSLAGRYTVLMPNTARGGGISRKISNPQDRKRLKAIAAELDVPEGMGLIIRTAGAARTKQEIKRDYEYLLRLWESVRELALNSNAPALVYEEGNLIKRSIRDLYGKEVDEIIVAGEVAYREAKDFMRMLMPSHAKNVIYHQEAEQLFSRYQIERQLNAMFSPYVHLKSGGYLVINQTEALVAIDINSGKSTREFSIEETAYSTNMEAADEIARQLKLRDLAGLIVIDFIDMEEKRNNRAVERRIKDALRHDRARIQLGHISHFGLMEMSRQRMRTGVLEGSTTQCPHCQGTGIIRSTESVALAVLRGLEDALMAGPPASLLVTTTATVALYILNNKRGFIAEMEARYGIVIQVQASEKMQGANFSIERTARREDAPRRPERTAVNMESGFEDEDADSSADVGQDDGSEEVYADEADTGGDGERHGREGRSGEGHAREGQAREGQARDGQARDGQGREGQSADGQNGEGKRGKRRRRRRGRRSESEGGHAHHGGERTGYRQPAVEGDEGAAEGTGERSFAAAGDDENRREGRGYHGGAHDHADGDTGAPEAEAGEPIGGSAEREGHVEGEGQGQGEGQRGRRRRRGRRGGRRGAEREGSDVVRGEGDTVEANGNTQDAGMPIAGIGGHDVPTGEVAADRDTPNRGDHRQFARDDEPLSSAQPPEPSSWRSGDAVPVSSLLPESVQREEAPAVAANAIPAPYEDIAPSRVAETAKPELEPAEQASVASPTASRREPVAGEPVLARVVVRPDNAVVQEADEVARPARRGWWQRK